MKTLKKAFYFPLLFLSTILFPISGFAVIQPFNVVNPSNTKNVQGNYTIAGNTVMCLTEKTSGYGGTCGDVGYELLTSNLRVSKYIDIDGEDTTWNSTSSYITLPSTLDMSSSSPILWAGLFWQGRIVHNDTNLDLRYAKENATTYDLITTNDGSQGNVDFSTTGAYDIKLKVNNGNYIDVAQDTFYITGGASAKTYAAYADVTNIVAPAILTDGKHTFTVANLTTNEGRESTPGVFGGWSLVVIYAEDSFGKMRNISIYSGFDSVANPSAAFTITDFLLPKENSVNATLSLFSGEGEYLYGERPGRTTYDWIKISNDGSTYTSMPNALHPNNIFDSRFTGVTRDDIPGHSNNLQINNDGVDIDSFDVSALMTAYRDVNPNMNTMHIQWSSNNDYITPSMIAFATELYVPEFCYDYAYKQQGKYFTEKNDGTENPRIVGDVLSGEEVEVTLFLRNLVTSDIDVQDLTFNITDINATQALYTLGTTSIAQIPAIIPSPLADSGTTTQTDIRDIFIGDMGSNDYFYIYYKLDPKKSSLDMPINASAKYHLKLDGGDTINYELKLGAHINICRNSNYDYEPIKGAFNIVHNDYYSNGGYYNLPTQVTSREGNFQVISMNPDNLDELKAFPNTMFVGVQLIDVSSFHDTFTACKELESAIGPKLWLKFEAGSSSTPFDQNFLIAASIEENNLSAVTGIPSKLPNSYDFYKTANENTAFRISYNLVPNTEFVLDANETSPGEYVVHNFENIKGITCSDQVHFINKNGNPASAVQANDACGNASGKPIGESQFKACMECLYGVSTKLVCSRDNFSIRPEAILIKLQDQNQSNSSSKLKIGDDMSGVVTLGSTTKLDMAAGYQYTLEANATNHRDNKASPGYTKTYGITNDDKYLYVWDSSKSACNDQADKQLDIRYLEGEADLNTSVDQVGLYKLNQTDKEWTTVDNDLSHMTHHTTANNFLINTTDCILDNSDTKSATTFANAATPLQGCDISSNHDASFNSNIFANLKYRDYSIEFHPYKFDLSNIRETVGLAHSDINATVLPFVYMSDMSISSVDENMSYHLNGKIEAQGHNDVALTNFVENCYAHALEIDLNITTMNLPVAYQYRFHSLATDKTDINTHNGDLNNTGNLINLVTADFPKTNLGAADTIINLNYNRTNSFTVNPEQVTFNNYYVDCTIPTNCDFNADLISNKTSKGVENLSTTAVNYYYGRTHAPRNRFVGPTGDTFIYYEVYCNGTTPGGSICNKTLLQNGLNSRVTDDPRWFRNEQHVVTSHGKQGIITQKGAANVAAGTITNTTGRTTVRLTYNASRDYPYKATMENNASRFLIYNKYDIANTNTTNEFEVEFVNTDGNWAGKAESTATTGEIGSKKTNRRSMW